MEEIEKVEKIIEPKKEYKIYQPEMNVESNNEGLLVKISFDPIKNHIHVEANIQDGDELVLMMIRKAYDAWKKRVFENIEREK